MCLQDSDSYLVLTLGCGSTKTEGTSVSVNHPSKAFECVSGLVVVAFSLVSEICEKHHSLLYKQEQLRKTYRD